MDGWWADRDTRRKKDGKTGDRQIGRQKESKRIKQIDRRIGGCIEGKMHRFRWIWIALSFMRRKKVCSCSAACGTNRHANCALSHCLTASLLEVTRLESVRWSTRLFGPQSLTETKLNGFQNDAEVDVIFQKRWCSLRCDRTWCRRSNLTRACQTYPVVILLSSCCHPVVILLSSCKDKHSERLSAKASRRLFTLAGVDMPLVRTRLGWLWWVAARIGELHNESHNHYSHYSANLRSFGARNTRIWCVSGGTLHPRRRRPESLRDTNLTHVTSCHIVSPSNVSKVQDLLALPMRPVSHRMSQVMSLQDTHVSPK